MVTGPVVGSAVVEGGAVVVRASVEVCIVVVVSAGVG